MPSVVDDGIDDPRVARAFKEYVAALESGNPPDREEFLAAARRDFLVARGLSRQPGLGFGGRAAVAY